MNPFKFAAFILICLSCNLVATYTIQNKEVQYSVKIPISSFTENRVPVNNPVPWQAIETLAKDGSFVRKNDIVVTFDTDEKQFQLKKKELDLEVIEMDLQSRLDDISNKENSMVETLSRLDEQLEIERAKLQKYLSIPKEEEIRMSQGRLKIAQMNMDAADSDLSKAKDRLEKKMISPAEFEKAQFDFYEKKALYEYAKSDLELTSLPTSQSTISRTRLKIESIELEKEKLQLELEDFSSIADIQRKNAEARKSIHLSRIKEIKEDITNSRISSSVDGYVSLEDLHGETISEGMKLWKSFRIMHIEDISTLSLKGSVDEDKRQFFQVGDSAEVYINGKKKTLQARIKSIGNFARDMAEKDKTDWGDVGKKYGIKVYDLTLEILSDTTWLKPGMKGHAFLHASESISKPAIPIKYLNNKEDSLTIFDGKKHHPVSGYHNQGWFYFDSDEWFGKNIEMGSLQPKQNLQEQVQKTNNRFQVTGEMKAGNFIEILTGEIRNGSKISWLIPEESKVTMGDVVARITDQDLQKDLTDAKTKLEKAQGELEEVLKQRLINERESAFKLKKLQNELEIAKINHHIATKAIDSQGYINASLNLEQAKIKLENWQNQLANEEKKTLTSRSPIEIEKMKLELKKAELQLDKANINMDIVKRGEDEITKNKASLDLLVKEIELSILNESLKLDEVKSQIGRNNKERNLYWNQRHMNRILKRQDALAVKATANGIIEYNTTWVSGGIGKISVGTTVRRRQSIIKLPDYSTMFLTVNVPERYYSKTKIGQKVDIEIPSLNNTLLSGEISEIDVLFRNKSKPDSDQGLYSSHEPLGEVNFTVKIQVDQSEKTIKPGAVGIVSFPFSE